MESVGKNQVWREGHKFVFGHGELEVLSRPVGGYVGYEIRPMSVGFRED